MNEKFKIALVDDDHLFLNLLKETLMENPEYKILTFQSGEECIDHLHLDPDVIVLDYFLNSQNPDAKNGIEILKKIKLINPKIKVIVLSGQIDANVLYDFMRLNVANYLAKDNHAFENTRMAIENVLSHKKLIEN